LVARDLFSKVVRNLCEAQMPRPKRTEDGLTKFQRYRLQQRHRGMKQLRLWVPDPNRPEFAEEAKRQGLLLRGRPEEAQALEFIAAAIEWPEA
jgi:hypothetical protein